jgi:hypothetical protein
MDLPVVAALAVACLLLAVFCGWRGARPWNPAKGVRMIPYRPLMLLFAALSVIFLIWTANMAGLMGGN